MVRQRAQTNDHQSPKAKLSSMRPSNSCIIRGSHTQQQQDTHTRPQETQQASKHKQPHTNTRTQEQTTTRRPLRSCNSLLYYKVILCVRYISSNKALASKVAGRIGNSKRRSCRLTYQQPTRSHLLSQRNALSYLTPSVGQAGSHHCSHRCQCPFSIQASRRSPAGYSQSLP